MSTTVQRTYFHYCTSTAKGLDIPPVTHVIQFDLPESIEEYVHRTSEQQLEKLYLLYEIFILIKMTILEVNIHIFR